MAHTLYTRSELAAILSIKPRTVWHMEKRGDIKPVGYVSGRPRYALEDIVKTVKDKQTSYGRQ